jgi:hypothetical protein
MQLLIEALDKKDIPSEELTTINDHIVSINSFGGTDKELTKELKKTYKIILSFIEENLKLVPKNHFRALWIVYGSLAGVVLSSIFANFNFINFNGLAMLPLPLAVAAGILVGIAMDNSAKNEGRQIELEAQEY